MGSAASKIENTKCPRGYVTIEAVANNIILETIPKILVNIILGRHFSTTLTKAGRAVAQNARILPNF